MMNRHYHYMLRSVPGPYFFFFFLLAAEQNIHRYGKCLCYIVHTTMFLAENAKRGREQACTEDTYSSHAKWFDLSEEGNLCQKSPQLTQMLGIMTAFMGTRRLDKKEKRNHVSMLVATPSWRFRCPRFRKRLSATQ